jgi:flagellar biosynthesis/type III secretory pathway protein FliH
MRAVTAAGTKLPKSMFDWLITAIAEEIDKARYAGVAEGMERFNAMAETEHQRFFTETFNPMVDELRTKLENIVAAANESR